MDHSLLLGDDEDFTPKFEEVLRSLFLRFDCNGDNQLNVEELNSFALVCNGEHFPEDEIQEMRVRHGTFMR